MSGIDENAKVLNSRPESAEALRAWASVLFKAAWYAAKLGQFEVAEKMNRGQRTHLVRIWSSCFLFVSRI